jgi:hypothetical protein
LDAKNSAESRMMGIHLLHWIGVRLGEAPVPLASLTCHRVLAEMRKVCPKAEDRLLGNVKRGACTRELAKQTLKGAPPITAIVNTGDAYFVRLGSRILPDRDTHAHIPPGRSNFARGRVAQALDFARRMRA